MQATVRNGFLVSIGAVVATGLALVSAHGPEGAQARGIDIDLAVAKEKSGPFRSAGEFTGAPPANPQLVQGRIEPGEARAFWVRIKNSSSTAAPTVYLLGDDDAGGFDVTYKASGEDVTDDITSCQTFATFMGQKSLYKMRIENTGATPGSSADFSIDQSFEEDCDPEHDVGWVRAKAPAE